MVFSLLGCRKKCSCCSTASSNGWMLQLMLVVDTCPRLTAQDEFVLPGLHMAASRSRHDAGLNGGLRDTDHTSQRLLVVHIWLHLM
jgi:hypothetical protein